MIFQITLHRTWGALSPYDKVRFIWQFLKDLNFEIRPEDVERLKNSDLLTEMLKEVSQVRILYL